MSYHAEVIHLDEYRLQLFLIPVRYLPLSVRGVVVIYNTVSIHSVQGIVMRRSRSSPSWSLIHIPTKDKRHQILSSGCAWTTSPHWFVQTVISTHGGNQLCWLTLLSNNFKSHGKKKSSYRKSC